jgi:hypothetical protein
MYTNKITKSQHQFYGTEDLKLKIKLSSKEEKTNDVSIKSFNYIDDKEDKDISFENNSEKKIRSINKINESCNDVLEEITNCFNASHFCVFRNTIIFNNVVSDCEQIFIKNVKSSFSEWKKLFGQNDSLYYQGQVNEDGNPHGVGIAYAEGVPAYIGYFQDAESVGWGKSYTSNGKLSYEGFSLNGESEGLGISWDKNGEIQYVGNHSKGKVHGQGVIYHNDKPLYEGLFENGKLNEGKSYHSEEGYLVYKGWFVNWKYEGFGTLYKPDGNIDKEGFFLKGEFQEIGSFSQFLG